MISFAPPNDNLAGATSLSLVAPKSAKADGVVQQVIGHANHADPTPASGRQYARNKSISALQFSPRQLGPCPQSYSPCRFMLIVVLRGIAQCGKNELRRAVVDKEIIMKNLWRCNLLVALALTSSGAIVAQTILPQDNQATQPNTGAPKTKPRPATATKAEPGAPVTSSQQDHVTGSRSSPDPKSKANTFNRAVAAPGAPRPAHPARHPKAEPSPAAEQSGAPEHRTPVESHSAIQQNPQLPNRMPPPQGSPSAPTPNQNPKPPQNP